jgi:signal transduction histidine kinase
VRLAPEGSDLVLEIHDNGRGFEPMATPPHGHYGIANMHDRAKALHGDLVVDSAPGSGTRIIVRIPVAGYGEAARADD